MSSAPYNGDSARQDHTKNLVNFVKHYSVKLRDFQHALSQVLTNKTVGNILVEPIEISTSNVESVPYTQIMYTGFESIDKLLATFSQLMGIASNLCEISAEKVIPPLLLFGELTVNEAQFIDQAFAKAEKSQLENDKSAAQAKKNGLATLHMSNFLNHLIYTAQCVSQLYSVIENAVHQLALIYNSKNKMYQMIFKYIQLDTFFTVCLVRPLSVLLQLDEIFLNGNPNLVESWESFRVMVQAVERDPLQYPMLGLENDDSVSSSTATSSQPPTTSSKHQIPKKLKNLITLVDDLEHVLFSGSIYSTFISTIFDRRAVPYPTLAEIESAKKSQKEWDLQMKKYQDWEEEQKIKAAEGKTPEAPDDPILPPPPEPVNEFQVAGDPPKAPVEVKSTTIEPPPQPRPSIPPAGGIAIQVNQNKQLQEAFLSYLKEKIPTLCNSTQGIVTSLSSRPNGTLPLDKVVSNGVKFPLVIGDDSQVKNHISSAHEHVTTSFSFENLKYNPGFLTFSNQRNDLIGIFGLFKMYLHVFNTLCDTKLFINLIKSVSNIPFIHVSGMTLFNPEEFIKNHLHSMIGQLSSKEVQLYITSIESIKQSFIISCDVRLENLYTACLSQVLSWTSRMDSIQRFASTSTTQAILGKINVASQLINDKEPILRNRIDQFGHTILYGYIFSHQINHLVRDCLFLHTQTQMPLTSSMIQTLGRFCELVLSIKLILGRNSIPIQQFLKHYSQTLTIKISSQLGELLVACTSSRKPTKIESVHIDQIKDPKLKIAAICSMQCIRLVHQKGASSNQRLQSLYTLLDIIQGTGVNFDFQKIFRLLSVFSTVINFSCLINRATNFSDLYWVRDLFPQWLDAIVKNTPHESFRLVFMFALLTQIGNYLGKAKHCSPTSVQLTGFSQEGKELPEGKKLAFSLTESFSNEVVELAGESLIQPICQAVETDLRLLTHSHLDVAERNLVTGHVSTGAGTGKLLDVGRFIKMGPLIFMDKTFDIKQKVEYYLNYTFYNLNALALYNWEKYTHMRNLAAQKYGLQLIDPQLPGHASHGARDVVKIMRNIHQFVSTHVYSLNTQVFVSIGTSGKHLETVRIIDMANSIKAHGSGIMNTAVNVTYQYLRQQFAVISKFLYGAHVNSPLLKDQRFYKINREKLDNKFPYERAESFCKQIRQLTAKESSRRVKQSELVTYLDKFRKLISEIGNALGYVRMVRAGGLNFISKAIQYVPDVEQVEFKQSTVDGNLSETTQQSCDTLEHVINDLVSKFGEGTDYFKLLVEVFTGPLRHERNNHLKLFPYLVPALTISFCDHIIKHKDKLGKRGNLNPLFIDDGFALGVAYILRLLAQDDTFEILHWFESVDCHYTEKIKEITDKLKGMGITDIQNRLQQSASSSAVAAAPSGSQKPKSSLKRKSTIGRLFSRKSKPVPQPVVTPAPQQLDNESTRQSQTLLVELKRLIAYQKEFQLLDCTLSSSRVFFRDLGSEESDDDEADAEQKNGNNDDQDHDSDASPSFDSSSLPPPPESDLPPPPPM